ncbi:MAG: Spy/CpxP family protein refolding chaperone [Bacillota bacterium]|nr:Spy/CpxP family protein refolding chaperone [Bacillota bacterium]MDI7250513.1 Spy/CpxP family protein refolding chaperone [Bacillota bacterium]
MRKRLTVCVLVAVLVLGVAGAAAAAPWGFGLGPAPRRGDVSACVKAIKDLGLTDEQVQKIQEIQASAFQQLKDIQNALFQKMFELQQLLWQKNPDEDAITAKQEELRELRQQMYEIQQKVREEMKGVLTQEQLNKLQQGWGPGHCRGRRGGFRGMPPSGKGSVAPGSAPSPF